MANDTAKTQTTNIVAVQGTFEPLPPYDIISFIGPAGTPFYAPVNPNLDGVNITNSTINSTTIGQTTPAAAAFTSATATTMPTGQYDLTNKLYVDAALAGISWKQPVLAATTANITLSGAQTIDTVSVVAGDRVLVKNQTDGAENGIYVAAAGAWARSDDANAWDELVSAMVFVEAGSQGGSAWYCYVQQGGTLGTTDVTWSNFSVAGTYFAGTGLTLAANTFSITNTGVTAASYGSASAVPTYTVNAQGQLTAAADVSIALNANQITSGTLDSARLSGPYSGITAVGTLTGLTVSSTISGSISGNAATATSATSATTATNLAGGANGSLPYQTGSGATTFLAAGTNGQYLTLSSGVPAWATLTPGDVSGPASSTDNAIARFDSTTGKIIQNSAITLSDAGALQNVNEINFDTTPTSVAGGTGSMAWNSGDGTLDLVLDADVTIQLGQENIVKVYNNSASTITNGQVVAVNGAQGQRPAVVLADADSEPLSAATLGVATEDIAAGAEGFVTTFGVIRGIDTSAFTAGDPVYLSQTAGQFTATRPSAPAHTVFLGWVIKVNASSGELFLNINNGWELDELHNVKITNVQNDDLLQYNSSGPYWENVAPSTVAVGTSTNLAGGATGSLPYQSTAGTTTFLAAGTDGQVLKLASGVPTWSSDASGVTISDDTTTNATRYLTFTDATTGNVTTEYVSSTKLQFNPSNGLFSLGGTSAIKVPVGTEAQRPGTPAAGMFRFNDDTDAFEGYDGTAWGAIGGGSNITSYGLWENAATISANYSITAGNNAMSAGPITVDSGVTVTVPSGSTWTVV